MNKNILVEAFKVSKGKTTNDKNIAFIDPNIPENTQTFKYKDVFKKHGARWDNNNKFWFWYIGDKENNWKFVFDKYIKEALKEVHKLEGATDDESKESIIMSLDAILGKISEIQTSTTIRDVPTEDDKKNIKDRLLKFKEMIVDIDNDEEFKETMMSIKAFKDSQGHTFSFNNTLLIMLQNPNAKLVKSRSNWSAVNRRVKDDADNIWIFSPDPKAIKKYSPQAKEEITNNFLKFVRKRNVNDLTTGESEKLRIKLRGSMVLSQYVVTSVFDIKDTEVFVGKPDLIDSDSLDKYEKIKWFEEDITDEQVKPIFDALMDFSKVKGITVEFIDELSGARGSSAGGVIKILKTSGNDVGLTKTLAHELTHELLHQTYAKSKDKELEQYFIGKEQGRDLIEQQAELSAWMILAEYGFNLKTTSINYLMLWGADKEKMVVVFDTVSKVVNYILRHIDEYIKNLPPLSPQTEVSEETEMSVHRITPMDVAKFIGVEDIYADQLRKKSAINQLRESYIRFIK